MTEMQTLTQAGREVLAELGLGRVVKSLDETRTKMQEEHPNLDQEGMDRMELATISLAILTMGKQEALKMVKNGEPVKALQTTFKVSQFLEDMEKFATKEKEQMTKSQTTE